MILSAYLRFTATRSCSFLLGRLQDAPPRSIATRPRGDHERAVSHGGGRQGRAKLQVNRQRSCPRLFNREFVNRDEPRRFTCLFVAEFIPERLCSESECGSTLLRENRSFVWISMGNFCSGQRQIDGRRLFNQRAMNLIASRRDTRR